jgi:hypothetical protein
VNDVDLLEDYSYEADDVGAVCCKLFSKDYDVVLITKDCDWEMLCAYPNTKFFSMNLKYKGGTGVYKPVENAYKVLDGKIRKGDKSDNIIIPEIDTERDKEIRELIIDLIHLPSWVEAPIKQVLENLPKKECHFENLPFPNSLAKKFLDIYSPEKIITYEESVKRIESKKVRAKNRKKKAIKDSTMRKVEK